jgi:hypothetical protein
MQAEDAHTTHWTWIDGALSLNGARNGSFAACGQGKSRTAFRLRAERPSHCSNHALRIFHCWSL